MADERLFETELAIPVGWKPEVKPFNGERLEIVVDDERVHEVLSALLAAYQEKSFPYDLDSTRLPQDPRHMPPSLVYGTRDHAMFLWNSCRYMRGGTKSVTAFKRLSRVYEEQPDLFDCEVMEKLDPPDIAPVLKAHGLGFQESAATEWIENAKRLQERFDGDPRNIFEGIETYEDCLKLIKNDGKGNGFIGFQEKMTSMIIYYLMYEKLIKPFVFPIPIDLHVMRVSIANEMITFPNVPNGTDLFKKETLAALRKMYYDYAFKHGIDPLELCAAVWLLSESICKLHPGNITLEPHKRKHRKGRKTYLVPKVVDIHDRTQQRAYEASCRRCPVESSCRHVVPGKLNYVVGAVSIRGARIKFPAPLSPPAPAKQYGLFDT